MISIEEVKANGKQVQDNENIGTFYINVFSPYFKQEVKVNFYDIKNEKEESDFIEIVRLLNNFIQLHESKIEWMKEIVWKNCLYSLEAAGNGFSPIPKSPRLEEVTLSQISILKDFPTANIANIKKNMNHFKIFNKEEAFLSIKLKEVAISIEGKTISFAFSTLWDDSHDIAFHTDYNYRFYVE